MAGVVGFVSRRVKRLLGRLESPQHVRALVLSHIRVFSVQARTKQHYDKTFGDTKVGPTTRGRPMEARFKGRSLRLFGSENVSEQVRSAITSAGFPAEFNYYLVFRIFTTIWHVYVILKFVLGQQFGQLIVMIRGKPLRRPIGCYLLGRYILHESFAGLTSALFSASHLAWRFAQCIASAYRMNLVYFLLIAERDLERAHAKLDPPGASIELAPDELERVDLHEKFLLETLCFKISKAQVVIYKIRPNRTREAHLRLRQMLVKCSLVAWLLIAGITISLVPIFTFMIISDERFLRLYPNCDPQMERLKAQEKIAFWSVTMTPGHVTAAIADGLENFALWWDGGLLWTLGPVFIYCLNYDLVLQWDSIQCRIDQLLDWNEDDLDEFQWREHADELLELKALIADFFEQVKMANVFLSNFLNGAMSLTLLLCAVYSYLYHSKHMQQVPLSIALVFIYKIFSLTFSCNGFLIVNRRCLGSYARFCSLIALESSRRNKRSLQKLMEFFTSKRSCFTLLHNYPFEAATFLTVIGWSFSCFFVVASLLHRN